MKNKVMLIKTLALIFAFLSSFEAFANDYTVTVKGFYFGYDPSTGNKFPLKGARVILMDSDADGSTIFDDEMGSSHINADGSFTITGRGGDPGGYNWSKPDVYIRVVYNNDKGVRLTNELDQDRYVDTPQHDHNNVEGDLDFGTWTVGLDGDKGNATQCGVWMAGCKAWDEYVGIMAEIPPSGKFDIEYWSGVVSGTPWTNTTTSHWPIHYETNAMRHEFGHLIRHAFDGNADHFTWDATRFRYARSHSRCDQNSNRIGTDTRDMGLAFGFNEGWAEFWADDVSYCGYDFDEECEGNIASTLNKISTDPRYGIGNKALGKKGMVEILKAHPGQIHSLDDFLKFVTARTSFNLTEVRKMLQINKAVVGSSQSTINNNVQAKATVSNRIELSNAQKKAAFDKIYQVNENAYNQILNALNQNASKNIEAEASKADIQMKFAKFRNNAKNGIFPISSQTQVVSKEDVVRQTQQGTTKPIIKVPPVVVNPPVPTPQKPTYNKAKTNN